METPGQVQDSLLPLDREMSAIEIEHVARRNKTYCRLRQEIKKTLKSELDKSEGKTDTFVDLAIPLKEDEFSIEFVYSSTQNDEGVFIFFPDEMNEAMTLLKEYDKLSLYFRISCVDSVTWGTKIVHEEKIERKFGVVITGTDIKRTHTLHIDYNKWITDDFKKTRTFSLVMAPTEIPKQDHSSRIDKKWPCVFTAKPTFSFVQSPILSHPKINSEVSDDENNDDYEEEEDIRCAYTIPGISNLTFKYPDHPSTSDYEFEAEEEIPSRCSVFPWIPVLAAFTFFSICLICAYLSPLGSQITKDVSRSLLEPVIDLVVKCSQIMTKSKN